MNEETCQAGKFYKFIRMYNKWKAIFAVYKPKPLFLDYVFQRCNWTGKD
jgi:hypothetical protein